VIFGFRFSIGARSSNSAWGQRGSLARSTARRQILVRPRTVTRHGLGPHTCRSSSLATTFPRRRFSSRGHAHSLSVGTCEDLRPFRAGRGWPRPHPQGVDCFKRVGDKPPPCEYTTSMTSSLSLPSGSLHRCSLDVTRPDSTRPYCTMMHVMDPDVSRPRSITIHVG
jgi:hypothetical protein